MIDTPMAKTSQTNSPLVCLANVSKHYPDGNVTALDDVSLSIQPGEFVSITGPSGCGKSTLLNMIGALDRPTSGQIFFRGKSLAESVNLDRLRSREIGFVFQSFHLLPNLTAQENVQLPMFGDTRDRHSRQQDACSLLAKVGLGDRTTHLPHQLSNGQRQRVAIARALANNPTLVLADEPTGALDSESGMQVMNLLQQLCRNEQTTLVVVTHDVTVASRADRTIQLCDGRIAVS